MTITTPTYSRLWNRRLDDLREPPTDQLYTRGEQTQTALGLNTPTVAIVGARACSDYGAHLARRLASELAASGVTVISGLARGIDGWAHAAPSKPAAAPSPSSAAASTATTPEPTPTSPAKSPSTAGSSPNTNPASRPHRGGSRPGTESSPHSPTRS
jgi:hypothetical protein